MSEKENQLIEKCKKGDAFAMEWLYTTYAPAIMGICLRYVNNRIEAEDILQESFIDVYANLSQLRNNTSVFFWMRRITVNNALKYLKNKPYNLSIDEYGEIAGIEENPVNESKDYKNKILNSNISQEEMLEVINGLPPGFRTVFNLYVFEKLKHAEIAKRLGISIGTSKSQLLRARKLIQSKLYERVKKNEKSRKKENLLLTSMVFVMNKDLEYIDKLVFDKLELFNAPLNTNSYELIRSSARMTKSPFTRLKMKIGGIIGSKVSWIFIVITGSVITGFLLLKPDQTSLETNCDLKGSVLQENIPLDSDQDKHSSHSSEIKTSNPKRSTNDMESIVIDKNESEPIHKKVVVRKQINMKKQIIVRDTIRKIDTLPTY